MSTKTAIQWTDSTWNPTTGCTRVSEGCRNCYIERTPAFRMAGRKFVNGKTGVLLHPDRLEQPLHWKKPRRIFVNSMSDLFHEDVPDEFIDRVFAIMASCRGRHTFQVLTKRPERMRQYVGSFMGESGTHRRVVEAWEKSDGARSISCPGWPLPNVWLGISCENQQTADKRIPLLLQTPAAVRFVSAEPLLGPISLHGWDGRLQRNYFTDNTGPGLDWVIVGGESGPKARPCNLDWVRSIVRQCRDENVPPFVKQLGAKPFEMGCAVGHTWIGRNPQSLHRIVDHKGGDMTEWPADLRVREFPMVDREG